MFIGGSRAILIKGSNCSSNGCVQVQQSPSMVVNDDVVRMRADGRTSWRKAQCVVAGRSVSLTAEHDVNDAPEMVAVEA